MHRIEAAHAAHTAVDWLLHHALPWIGLGVVFGLSAAVAWRALNRIRDYITACRRISGELDQLADEQRQAAELSAIDSIEELNAELAAKWQQMQDEPRKEKP